MAAEGRFAKRNGDPVLVLHGGSIQQFSKTGVLDVLSFDENVLPLKPFLVIEGEVLFRTPPIATCTSCFSRTCANPGTGPTTRS